jgi:hypothetical protein
MHKKKEWTHSSMGLVESNMVLFTTMTDQKKTIDKYYKVSKAQINMIEAHGRNLEYHCTLYRDNLNTYTEKKEV